MDNKKSPDGREQRRINNKQRATEIMLELILESGEMPDVETILARSGISRRSFFRFFQSEGIRLYEVNNLMANRVASRFEPLVPDAKRSLGETLTLFLNAKSQLDEYRMPLRKLTEEKKRTSPEIDSLLNQYRASWLEYIEELFALYLEHRTERDILLQHIHFNTSWSIWAALRNDFNLSIEESCSFIERQIMALFGESESE